MEFYESEATLLTEVKLRSILLLKVHKTPIARHHRLNIFLIICQNFIGSSSLVYGYYIARFSLIFYYYFMFYSWWGGGVGRCCYYYD